MFAKKSQSAIEFLTTYGWVIFVVIFIISLISYTHMNVFSFLDEDLYFGSQIKINDILISKKLATFDQDKSVVSLYIQNNFGRGINVTNFKLNINNKPIICDYSSNFIFAQGVSKPLTCIFDPVSNNIELTDNLDLTFSINISKYYSDKSYVLSGFANNVALDADYIYCGDIKIPGGLYYQVDNIYTCT